MFNREFGRRKLFNNNKRKEITVATCGCILRLHNTGDSLALLAPHFKTSNAEGSD
jgi:hypothetical protein